MQDMPESGKDHPISEILDESEVAKSDEQLAQLQNDLQFEKDARHEERFVFIVICVMLLDVVFFSVMPSFAGPLALVILQLVVLIPLARRMGMEEISQMLSSVLNRAIDKGNNGE